jgi:hypothetical protein
MSCPHQPAREPMEPMQCLQCRKLGQLHHHLVFISISFYSSIMRLDKLSQMNDIIDDNYILSDVANVS